ncbi:hypothetical protein [Psittacicella gerlachiana]|uniref:Uncharacterized protein n=1 Tax=Psittacicella gerlachiana TaxID=2028574 RepID=A0A3A1YDV4_9GAMM|nr:hypothetical protein [Psittacicella gerlachiana]RIY35721.1 hypothetical protein CKF59_03265 [Psittacicella gerlachiana]
MVIFTIIFAALMRVALAVGVIFLVVLLPLALVSRRAKIVRRYRRIKRASEKKTVPFVAKTVK